MKNLFLFLLIAAFSFAAFAQDKTTGGVRGKVRITNGDSVSGVRVEAQQDEKAIASTRTDRKGEFHLAGLKPGVYNFVFTKEGLAQGTLPRVEVKAGEISKLTRLVMAVDQGTLAIVRGSVFDANGRSVYGAKIEIFKISGGEKKVSQIFSSQSGEFIFRLPPAEARYRVAVTIEGAERGSQEIEVSGAQVYRVAISLKPKT
ncbi:MAG: carboxypeptidase-like regulatory domain-containing protein [Acidobacteriota bacterium]|nr:carboxypeptidase-like regulatory domain-containing protein [Acidobacteriota bacterium]